MVKLLLSLLMVLCLILPVFSGCGGKDNKKENSSSPASSSSVVRATPSPVPVQKAKVVRVKADDGLNIRSTPSTDGEILGLAENNSFLPLLVDTASDGWYQVEYEGKAAYVSAEFAEIKEVTLSEYNKLRSGGGLSSESSSKPVDDDPGKPVSSPSSQASSQEPSGKTESSKGAGAHNEDGE